MSAVWTVARAELRRNLSALLMLGLIVAATGAAVGGTLAVARRTSTAYERLERTTNADDARTVVVGDSTTTPAEVASRAVALPQVVASRFAPMAIGRLVGPQVAYVSVAAPGEPGGVLTPVLLEGREPRPDATDEAVIVDWAARDFGVEPGDRFTLQFLAPDQADDFSADVPITGRGPRVDLTIVGIVLMPGGMFSYAPAIAGPGVVEAYPEAFTTAGALAVRLHDEIADFEAFETAATEVGAQFREPGSSLPPIDFISTALARNELTKATDVEVNGLLVVAFIAAVTGTVLLLQAAARQHATAGPERSIMKALGLTRAQRASARALTTLPPALLAGILAGAVVLLAGLFESLGGTRFFEPNPGWAPNVAIALLTGVVTTLAMVAIATAFVLLPERRRRAAEVGEPRLVRRVASMGAHPSMVAALRYAFRRGPGSVRSSIAATLVAVLGLAGVIVFQTSLDRLVTTPLRYGWPADVLLTDATPAAIDTLVRDNRIDTVLAGVSTELELDGRVFAGVGWEPHKGSLRWSLWKGRPPEGIGEVVLSPSVASALAKGVGDTVVASGPANRRGSELEVVGVGVVPTFDSANFGEQAGFTRAGIDAAAPTPGLVEAAFSAAPGTSEQELVAEYAQRYEVTAAAMPNEIANLDQLHSLLTGLEIFLGAFAMLALIHAGTVTARRRRHELAVLAALGLRPRQRGAVLILVTVVIALVAAVIGAPLGAALGAAVWRLVAENAGVAGDAVFGSARFGLLAGLVVPAAFVVALIPAWRAARMAVASHLRAE
jgi:hypothetical protein